MSWLSSAKRPSMTRPLPVAPPSKRPSACSSLAVKVRAARGPSAMPEPSRRPSGRVSRISIGNGSRFWTVTAL